MMICGPTENWDGVINFHVFLEIRFSRIEGNLWWASQHFLATVISETH